jgi:hypothetical protein
MLQGRNIDTPAQKTEPTNPDVVNESRERSVALCSSAIPSNGNGNGTSTRHA